MYKRFATVVFFLIAFSSVCLMANVEANAAKLKIFVSVLPSAYFVERIGGPNVDVSVLVGPGQDPHTFELTPKTIAKLADARLLFKMGFPFEETLIKKLGLNFKNVETVDLQQGIDLRTMADETHGGENAHDERGHHKEGEEHKHTHEAGDMDPHTWLNPQLAKIQARTIAETLIRIDPSHKDEYEKNLIDLQADLDSVHDQLTKTLAPVKGKSFFVFHPAYGYFGDAYGLKQIPVQIGGKEPTGKKLARLIDLARKSGVQIIFVQPQFSKKSAEALAASIGGAVVHLDDLAPDYLKNLQEMAAKLDSALHGQKQ